MAPDLWWFAYGTLGLVSGFMAGLLGVGGGAIMVPVLAMVFTASGVPHEHVLHLALGTSMATIIFTAVSSLRTHHAHGAVMWDVVRAFAPGIVAGTLIGTVIAAHVSTRGLAVFFACFISLIAIQMAFNLKPAGSRPLPGALGLAGVGSGIGVVSALAAVGGGAMTVPYLTWCSVPVQRAIGTSAAVGLPIALAGTVGYFWNGWSQEGLPAAAVGFVYLPALLCLVVTSMLTAPIGARLAHRLPVTTLKRAFAALLVVLAGRMLWNVLSV
ncbi:sulfite exporter TauE/SafE family protein [Niveibacterium sp. 24ML]|uniref:sulfite exporter TauE/SafE family protein n=1 Tax=Niveibacterium sp. 24ML TaxID=2985512 RepID=UPI00226FA79C|nr:sulfite exporter TauE/SafE family protein [Niveibacterium sp. 24ML]MCX9155955.1 sulfite exporter TauE/SafE family protein [Niveibacterium sp. 24ML]